MDSDKMLCNREVLATPEIDIGQNHLGLPKGCSTICVGTCTKVVILSRYPT